MEEKRQVAEASLQPGATLARWHKHTVYIRAKSANAPGIPGRTARQCVCTVTRSLKTVLQLAENSVWTVLGFGTNYL